MTELDVLAGVTNMGILTGTLKLNAVERLSQLCIGLEIVMGSQQLSLMLWLLIRQHSAF